MTDVLKLFLYLILLFTFNFGLAKLNESVKLNTRKLQRIESKLDQNAKEIERLKKELVIMDSVCQKVLDNEW